ncbi:MAG: V-type sodium ATPase catalytic subunit A [Candidatus Anoxychlamydiales bacterium]|nr:V-type sodium ATPase catalytic subunit A [Candidatus Anoxychlamydiales bacterium]
MKNNKAIGYVKKAFGNLLHVEFEGNICQGEVCFIQVDDKSFSAEVIEINGFIAKVQVFEDTKGVKLNTPVEFLGHLLEAELGPGLITSIFDGLQNPLEKIAKNSGYFLSRGLYIPPLDRTKKWNYTPKVKINDIVFKGDTLGEVTESHFNHQIMVPFKYIQKFTITYVKESGSYTIEEVIAKAKDEEGREYEFTMLQKWPVKNGLMEGKKTIPTEMLVTGMRILDTQFPILKGSTFCTPGPFGAGKTVLQHHLAKYSDVDIVIVAACGERAGEVVEILRDFPALIDNKTNEPLINRTVIICNTSSMPVAAREASVYMAVTIAEYYRQMGLNVLVLADSTSRWAQAMREMSGRLEEIPGEEAFPAYLASRIASFYERAGTLKLKNNKTGSLTIGGAVSPAGGNFEEPVTQATLAVVGAFWGLSRQRSDARRYPAIDPLISWTKYLVTASKTLNEKLDDFLGKINMTKRFIKEGDDILKRMEVVGEEGISINDMITYLKSELFDNCYLQQNSFDKVDTYCPINRQIELFSLLCEIFAFNFSFTMHDEARSFFLDLQNDIKNLNYIDFETSAYKETYKIIKDKIYTKKANV